MEIAPGIHRIECQFFETRMAYVHLFVGTECAMLVDTCVADSPQDTILPYIDSIGLDREKLKYIVISHSDLDHQGGNQPMKEAVPHALLMCHNLDKAWIEETDALIEGRYMQFDADHGFETTEQARADIHKDTLSYPIDMTLEGGERFRLSPDWYVEAVHTPGHTWGHLAVYDPKSKTMAAGEAALWNAILDIDWNPVLPPTYCYVDTYLATIERLMGMDIETYSSAHWQLKAGDDVQDFLHQSKNYCLFVEQTLLDYGKVNSPFTLKDAMRDLSDKVGEWGDEGAGLLTFPFAGNLARLVARGQLQTGRNVDGLVTWSVD